MVPPVTVRTAEKQLENYLIEIKVAKYGKVDLDDVIARQKHLTKEQRRDLRAVFEKHKELFDDTVGKYPRQFHLEIDPSVQPHYQMRPYPINKKNEETLKKSWTDKKTWESLKGVLKQPSGVCQCSSFQRKMVHFQWSMISGN